MRTWHVSTFCNILVPEINHSKVMPTVEITLVMNHDTPPSPVVIEGLLKMLAPNVAPLLSEINEVPYVPDLEGR